MCDRKPALLVARAPELVRAVRADSSVRFVPKEMLFSAYCGRHLPFRKQRNSGAKLLDFYGIRLVRAAFVRLETDDEGAYRARGRLTSRPDLYVRSRR